MKKPYLSTPIFLRVIHILCLSFPFLLRIISLPLVQRVSDHRLTGGVAQSRRGACGAEPRGRTGIVLSPHVGWLVGSDVAAMKIARANITHVMLSTKQNIRVESDIPKRCVIAIVSRSV